MIVKKLPFPQWFVALSLLHQQS